MSVSGRKRVDYDRGFPIKLVGGLPYPPPEGVQKGGSQWRRDRPALFEKMHIVCRL